MNVKKLQDNFPKLISYMEDNGYSKTYIERFKREIKKTLLLADSKDWSCYTDVYLEYTKTPHSPHYLRDKRTIIGAIEQFVVHVRYPDGRHRHVVITAKQKWKTRDSLAVTRALKKLGLSIEVLGKVYQRARSSEQRRQQVQPLIARMIANNLTKSKCGRETSLLERDGFNCRSRFVGS